MVKIYLMFGHSKHQNIVQFYKCGRSGDNFFKLVEFCQGGSVWELVRKKGGKLSIDLATRIILQVLDGLHYIHHVPVIANLYGKKVDTKGIVHRRITPKNILLSDDSSYPIAKIDDFTLCCPYEIEYSDDQDWHDNFFGSPDFMSRQIVLNFFSAKPEVDVRTAAACYYYMLTGFPPKDFSGKRDWVDAVISESAIPIQKRNPLIPKKLAEVIDTALIDKPKIIIKSALELKTKIEEALT